MIMIIMITIMIRIRIVMYGDHETYCITTK